MDRSRVPRQNDAALKPIEKPTEGSSTKSRIRRHSDAPPDASGVHHRVV